MATTDQDGHETDGYPDHRRDALPHESRAEAEARRTLEHLLRDTPVPFGELVDNLALYLGRKQLTDLLALDALYRQILDVPGVIMEFGTRWGRHIAALTALLALHDPYNVHRRIIGFDTFTGFPDVAEVDRVNQHARAGGLSTTPGYEHHLDQVLAAHQAAQPVGHVRRAFALAGDVRQTLPRYLADNSQTIVALAYFDLDLYEPTRDVLRALVPYLTRGSLLAFDQIGHAKWPGETAALREVLGTNNVRLELLPGLPSPVIMRWPPADQARPGPAGP